MSAHCESCGQRVPVFCECPESQPLHGSFGGAVGFVQCGKCGRGIRPVKK